MTSAFIDFDLEAYKAAFRSHDKDGSGTIDAVELYSLLKCLGQKPTLVQVKQMIEKVEKDNDGKLGFDEFINLLTTQEEFKGLVNHADELAEIFRTFDKNGDGALNKKEFKDLLQTWGVSEEEFETVFNDADISHDGVISMNEFLTLMTDSPRKKEERLSGTMEPSETEQIVDDSNPVGSENQMELESEDLVVESETQNMLPVSSEVPQMQLSEPPSLKKMPSNGESSDGSINGIEEGVLTPSIACTLRNFFNVDTDLIAEYSKKDLDVKKLLQESNEKNTFLQQQMLELKDAYRESADQMTKELMLERIETEKLKKSSGGNESVQEYKDRIEVLEAEINRLTLLSASLKEEVKSQEEIITSLKADQSQSEMLDDLQNRYDELESKFKEKEEEIQILQLNLSHKDDEIKISNEQKEIGKESEKVSALQREVIEAQRGSIDSAQKAAQATLLLSSVFTEFMSEIDSYQKHIGKRLGDFDSKLRGCEQKYGKLQFPVVKIVGENTHLKEKLEIYETGKMSINYNYYYDSDLNKADPAKKGEGNCDQEESNRNDAIKHMERTDDLLAKMKLFETKCRKSDEEHMLETLRKAKRKNKKKRVKTKSKF